MASTSGGSKSGFAMKETGLKYYVYPPPVAKYEEVVANSKLFMASLEKLHSSMGTKFMIPIIGGKELDLHRLFVEVTTRGGIQKIIRERRWKEVTAVFNFPSTATNASFVLRKYYLSLLHHYEQIYFFKAQGWSSISSDSLQSPTTSSVPVRPLPNNQAAMIQQPRLSSTELPGVPSRSAGTSSGPPVIGVIDGKFESGYLVTVTIGTETLKGVLYQTPHNLTQPVSASNNDITTTAPVHRRRRRRKKSEIKRRDPAHPKPNRSGYNFFFAEQHARLKPLYPGKDREISRMIGELWNKLNESERTVYQEKAFIDKERYRVEMEDYRERLRTGQVIRDAVPLQQRLPEPDLNTVDEDAKIEETEEVDSPQTPYNESSSSKSDSEEDDKIAVEDSDADMSPGLGDMNVDLDMSAENHGFEIRKREEETADKNVSNEREEKSSSSTSMEAKEEDVAAGVEN